MDRATVDVYEAQADRYADRRSAYHPDRAAAFAASVPVGAVRLDLGSGPGHYLPHLGTPVVAVDAAPSMVAAARAAYGGSGVAGLAADLEKLPLRTGAVAGVWASKSLQHVPGEQLPAALAGLHRVLAGDGRLDLTVFAGEGQFVADDDFPGRRFWLWSPEQLERLLIGAGFAVESMDVCRAGDLTRLTATARRARTLADTVGPRMRLLVCGLNPSLYAADAGVGFARPGNRFWPAAMAAGLVTVDRDPGHALARHGVGMTDLVKRSTKTAAELSADEYKAGLDRLRYLVEWLCPGGVCFVGLAGWRAAVDRRATAGVQPEGLGGRPVYVMPSTSGLNARTSLGELTDHLARAAQVASTNPVL